MEILSVAAIIEQTLFTISSMYTQNPFDLFFDGKTCCSTLSYKVSNCLIKENFVVNQYENNAEILPIKAPIATSKG